MIPRVLRAFFTLITLVGITTSAQAQDEEWIEERAPRVDAYTSFLEESTSFLFSFLRYNSRALPYTSQSTFVNGVELNSLGDGTTPYSALGSYYRSAAYSLNSTWERQIFYNARDARSGGYLSLGASSKTYSYSIGGGYNFNYSDSARYVAGVSVDRKFGRSHSIEGVWSDSWDFSHTGNIDMGEGGSLNYTLLFNPTERAYNRATTLEAYRLAGSTQYNPAWGYYGDEMLSVNVRRSVEPIAIINHDISFNKGALKLSSALGARTGESSYSALMWQGAPNPTPDYYAYLPSFQSSQSAADAITESWAEDVNARQINFNELVSVNSGRANYMIEERVSRPLFLSVQSALHNDKFWAGVTLAMERKHNFKRVGELLGADYWLDIDTYLEQDSDLKDVTQNNMLNPNAHATKGDTFGYNYSIANYNAKLSGAYLLLCGDFSINFAGDFRVLTSQRNGYYEKENFSGAESYGLSSMVCFAEWMARIEAHYSPSVNCHLDLELSLEHSAPTTSQLYLSEEYRNALTPGIVGSDMLGAAFSVEYLGERLRLSGSLYSYYQINDSWVRNMYDDMLYSYVNYSLRDISTLRAGIEASVEVNVVGDFWVKGAAVLQSNRYVSNPTGRAYEQSTGVVLVDDESVHFDDFHIGGAPENIAALSLSYQPYGWMVRLSGVYYSGGYEVLSPLRYTTRVLDYLDSSSTIPYTQEELPSGISLDLFGGYTKYFGNGDSFGIYCTFSNILNSEHLRYGYQSDRFFRDGTVLTPQDSRYYYGLPFSFSLRANYRF